MTDPRKWMPLYIGDYLRDTARLTTEQHGAYLLLIMDYWTAGPLPDDDEQLAAVAKLDAKRWQKLRPTMARFFQLGEGRWRHKRIDAEMEKAAAHTERRSKAGSTGAAKRWQTDSNAIPPPMANEKQNDGPSPSPSPSGSNEPESIERDFSDWYSTYPLHKGRGQALKGYRAARKRASAEQLKAGAVRYAAECRDKDPQFIRHPATWLNGEGWLDEAPPQKGATVLYTEPWPQRVSAWRGGLKWDRGQWGPEPGEPGCRVPPELLKDAA